MYKYWILLGFILQNIKGNDVLIQVQTIWRHGVRDFYYCNWGCDKNNEPDGDAQILTPAGMRQQYILGRWIRQRYIIDNPFLSMYFNENEIYIESTDYNRTIMSAYSNLQGMYPEGLGVPDVSQDKLLPPNKGSVAPNIGKDALPNKISLIPIHTKEEEIDYALAIYCRTTGKTNKQNKQTDLYHQINNHNKTQELFKMFNQEMSLKKDEEINDVIELAKWRDTFTCNRYNGDPLPEKLTAKTLFYMDKIALLSFSLRQFQTWEQSKRYSTPYLQQVLHNFEHFINGSSNVKYYGASSHDSTMLGILSGLNLTSAQCQADIYINESTQTPFCLTENVEFSSNLIFEFYNNSITGYSVRLLYNGKYVPICSETGTYCQYDHFKRILQNQFVDYETECDLIKQVEKNIQYKTPLWAILFFTFCMIFTIFVIFLAYKQRSNLQRQLINQIVESVNSSESSLEKKKEDNQLLQQQIQHEQKQEEEEQKEEN